MNDELTKMYGNCVDASGAPLPDGSSNGSKLNVSFIPNLPAFYFSLQFRGPQVHLVALKYCYKISNHCCYKALVSTYHITVCDHMYSPTELSFELVFTLIGDFTKTYITKPTDKVF